MGLFVWYFGTKRRYSDVDHHTIMLGPRYRGAAATTSSERKMLAEDFCLYLHRPTATDPSLAPPGCDAFYVLSPVPTSARDRLAAQAEPYRRAIQQHLEETVLPGLGKQIVTSMLTPQISATGCGVQRCRVRAGAALLAERLVPPAQPSARRCAACIWSAPARIRARACRA